MRTIRIVGLAAGLALPACGTASAHVVLETREAAVGSYYKAVFQVGHGCEGSPTTRLRIAIPNDVISVKPMQKPGWTLATTKSDYGKSYMQHGRPVTSGVREIVWSGGPLADDNYDEFVFVAYLTDALKPGTTIRFPVVQECAQGISSWTEVTAEGQPAPKMPAPVLKLLDGAHAHHH